MLLLVVVLFGLGMCRVAGRATESDAQQIDERLASVEHEARAQALREQLWRDAEPRLRAAAGES